MREVRRLSWHVVRQVLQQGRQDPVQARLLQVSTSVNNNSRALFPRPVTTEKYPSDKRDSGISENVRHSQFTKYSLSVVRSRSKCAVELCVCVCVCVTSTRRRR